MTAPVAPALQSLQYDIFHRYSLLARILAEVAPPPARIIDVGAGPAALTRRFLPTGYEVEVADIEDHGRPEVKVLMPGAALPFRMGEYDVALAMDVLEHVDAAHRAAFVDEVARVASSVVVLAFPHASDRVREAERALAGLFEKGSGVPHRFLAEHAQHGLPDADATAALLRERGFATAVLGSCRLSDWALLTSIDAMFAIAAGDCAEKAAFNRRANAVPVVALPLAESYRAFVVAARDPSCIGRLDSAAADWGQHADSGDEVHGLAAAAALGDFVAMQSARQLADSSTRDATVAQLRQALVAKDQHISKLEALVQQVARANQGRADA